MTPPILLIIFQRSETTRQLLGRLRAVKPPLVYVAADGPRPTVAGDRERCASCRAVIDEIDWPCRVLRRFSEVNQGCRWGPSNALDWFFEHEREGIILEDDILPEPTFFPFCAELLERYRSASSVGCICGYNFMPQESGSQSYFFSRIPQTWGWATWRDRWQLYAQTIETFEQSLHGLNVRDWLSRHDQKDIKRKIREAFEGDHVWDFIWLFSLWSKGLLSVVPSRSLTRNIGVGTDATHTFSEASFMAVQSSPQSFPLVHPAAVLPSNQVDGAIFHQLHHTPTLGERAWGVVTSGRPLGRLREILALRRQWWASGLAAGRPKELKK